MTPAALQTLIATGESLTLELKKSTAEKDRATHVPVTFRGVAPPFI